MVFEKADFSALVSKILSSFSSLPSNFVLSYVDEEGDRIAVSDSNDLKILFEIAEQRTIKLEVDSTEEPTIVPSIEKFP